MNNTGPWLLVAIFCLWPLFVHFAILFGPRVIRKLINKVPTDD